MSRFRVIKSKGRFYVVTTDSNGLAGGPYESPEEADQRAANLAALEAKHTAIDAARAKAAAANRMNITKGYRSPDVEDGRFDEPPFSAASAAIVERIFPGQTKWNTHDKKPPVDGWEPAWKKHHIPFEGDPVYPPQGPPNAPPQPTAPPFNLRDLGAPGGAFDWTPRSPWQIRMDNGKPKP